jgi:putative zinc finger protein
MKPVRRARPQLLAAYVEGELAAAEAAVVKRHLAESSDARRQVEQLRGIRSALSNSKPEFDEVDLWPSIKSRLHEHAAMPAQPSLGWLARLWPPKLGAALFATGLLTAVICLGLALPAHRPSARQFRAKSARQAPSPARWAGIQPYRVRAGKPEPLAETLGLGDGLLFSYNNLGPEPLTNLMIFALDSSSEVHWFYPAYERVGTNPSSITIEKGGAQLALPELVEADFPQGPLTIHALFSERSLRVLEVEAWLKRDPRTNFEALVPGSVDHVVTTRVER